MAATKVWVGTTGDFSLASNWRPVNIRNDAFRWLASGSGTGEYYLDLAGGGDPGVPEPPTVSENGTALTPGTAGTLAASEWDYADNDTLGYSTIYVRLADDADPDSKTDGHVTYTDIPRTGDAVDIPASSGTISSGLDFSGTTVAAVTIQPGMQNAIASASGYLRLSCTAFTFNGQGVSYIDLTGSAIAPLIKDTARPFGGTHGLNLLGTALTTLVATGGDTGLATNPGEASAVTTVRVVGQSASLSLGAGVSTVTTVQAEEGAANIACAVTTLTILGGNVATLGAGAIGTLNISGGNLTSNSSGTITALNVSGGFVDFYGSGVSRTVTALNLKRGGSWTVRLNKEAVTYTATTFDDSQTVSGGSL